MSTVGEVVVNLKAQSAEWSSGLKKADGDLKAFGNSAKTQGQSFIKSLKQDEALRSIKDIGKLLRGGGALAGIKFVGQDITNGLNKAADAARTLHSGTGNVGESILKMGEGIPVVGQLFSVANAGANLLVATQQAQADQNKKLIEQYREEAASIHQIKAELDDVAFTLERENALIADQNVGDVWAQKGVASLRKYEDELRQIDKLGLKIKEQHKTDEHLINGYLSPQDEDRLQALRAQAEANHVARVGQLRLEMGREEESRQNELLQGQMAGNAAILSGLQKELEALDEKGKKQRELNELHKELGNDPEAERAALNLKEEIEGQKKLADGKRILASLQREIATFGAGKGYSEILDAKAAGVSPEQLAQIKKAAKELEGLEKQKRESDEGKKLAEDALNPYEKFQAQIKHLDELLKDKAIDAKTYAAAAGKAESDMLKGANVADDRHTGAVTRRMNFALESRETERADPVEALQKQALSEEKKQSGYLAEIYRFQREANQQQAVFDF